MPYQKIIDDLYLKYKASKNRDKVASYIPKFKKADANKFGINHYNIQDESFGVGYFQEKNSIQSLLKTFTLVLVLKEIDEILLTSTFPSFYFLKY